MVNLFNNANYINFRLNENFISTLCKGAILYGKILTPGVQNRYFVLRNLHAALFGTTSPTVCEK